MEGLYHRPSEVKETEIEFLELSSAILHKVEALVVSVPVKVLFVLVLVREEEAVVVQRPVRPRIPGLPGFGNVNESLDSMRWTVYMSGRSEIIA